MEENSVKSRILDYIRAKGMSQKKFEQASGLSNGYLNSLRHAPSADKLSAILEAFPDLSRTWLLTGEGTMMPTDGQKSGGIPLIPQSAMAGALAGESNSWRPYDCEYYVIPEFANSDFLIRVSGDSMMPDFQPGDVLACRRVPLDRLWFQWGKAYIVDTRQGPLVKKIMPSDKDGCIKIVSANPNYPPFDLEVEEINGVALVEGFIRR